MNPATPTMALADAVFPVSEGSRRIIRDVVLVVSFALLTALFARISIPLGFTPVPITGQTLAVLLTGATLGSRRGASAMVLYLVAGSWLPFYAGGGSGYVWSLASGGYIIGYIPAAFVVGYLCEHGWDRRVWIILAMLLGNIILYIPGLIQLSLFVPGYAPDAAAEGMILQKTLIDGLYPFILGDLIKLYIASLALPAGWALLRWTRGDSAPFDPGR